MAVTRRTGMPLGRRAPAMAEFSADAGSPWFEEPVSSGDLEGLRLLPWVWNLY